LDCSASGANSSPLCRFRSCGTRATRRARTACARRTTRNMKDEDQLDLAFCGPAEVSVRISHYSPAFEPRSSSALITRRLNEYGNSRPIGTDTRRNISPKVIETDIRRFGVGISELMIQAWREMDRRHKGRWQRDQRRPGVQIEIERYWLVAATTRRRCHPAVFPGLRQACHSTRYILFITAPTLTCNGHLVVQVPDHGGSGGRGTRESGRGVDQASDQSTFEFLESLNSLFKRLRVRHNTRGSASPWNCASALGCWREQRIA
jgi:hypothetical protein